MRIRSRSLSFAAVLALTAAALPASATTQAKRSTSTVEHATLVCVKGGFTAALDVSVRRDGDTVGITLNRYRIDKGANDGGDRANVVLQARSRKAGTQDHGVVTSTRSSDDDLRQDGVWHAGYALELTVRADQATDVGAGAHVTFDKASSGDPACDTSSSWPAARGATCWVVGGRPTEVCWYSRTDRVLAINVTAKYHHTPEYIVLNDDGSENHRNPFAAKNTSRITLHAGQSLALTGPHMPIGEPPNTIEVISSRPLSQAPHPGVGEICEASDHVQPCFVVSALNLRMVIVVTGTPGGTAPEYYVADAVTGERKHGGRLEMGKDAAGAPRVSTIWVDAGMRFYLTPPNTRGQSNTIELADVVGY